jgi:hypothetical protein
VCLFFFTTGNNPCITVKKESCRLFLRKTPDAGYCVLIAEDHTIQRLEYLFEGDKLINILDLSCVRQKGIPETGNVL